MQNEVRRVVRFGVESVVVDIFGSGSFGGFKAPRCLSYQQVCEVVACFPSSVKLRRRKIVLACRALAALSATGACVCVVRVRKENDCKQKMFSY